MATQDTTVKAFVGLPIEDLICAPIIVAAKGQRALAHETLSFVEDLAFTGKENKDGSKEANIIIAVKDKNLEDLYDIDFDVVEEAFPDIEWGGRS